MTPPERIRSDHPVIHGEVLPAEPVAPLARPIGGRRVVRHERYESVEEWGGPDPYRVGDTGPVLPISRREWIIAGVIAAGVSVAIFLASGLLIPAAFIGCVCGLVYLACG